MLGKIKLFGVHAKSDQLLTGEAHLIILDRNRLQEFIINIYKRRLKMEKEIKDLQKRLKQLEKLSKQNENFMHKIKKSTITINYNYYLKGENNE